MFDPAHSDSSKTGSKVQPSPMFRAGMDSLAEALFRETGDVLILFDPATGAILEVNPTAQRLSGFSRDELLKMDTTWLLQAEGTDSKSRLQEAQQQSASFHARDGFVLRSRNAEGIPVNLTIIRLHLASRTLGLITARDVREQREAYNRLKKVEAEMRRVLMSVSDCLWSVKLDVYGRWTYRYLSPVVESITGRSPKFFMEKEGSIEDLRWRWIIDPRDLQRWESFVVRMRTETSSQEEYRVLKPTGEICWVRESVRSSPSSDGRSRLLDGVISDISVRKRTEEELKSAKDAAIAANRAKSEFLAHMSHEIRTPLNGILGMAELLHKSELNAVQRCYLEVLQGSATSLLTIINDILDFSKIEARKLELEELTFSLRETLSNALDVVAVQAHRKRLELSLHVHSKVPDKLMGDPNRFRQVILNLVNNAVKFTERGEIAVVVENATSHSAEPDQPVSLHVSVRDTGVGIPRNMLQQVFEAFAQVDPSTTRKYGGTGLGLGIASQLVQRMGGRIWAESEVGRGSTFHVNVEFRRGEENQGQRRANDSLRGKLAGKRILAVDDHASNRALLQDVLSSWGMLPTVLAETERAAEAFRQAIAFKRPFDLVIADANLDGVDNLNDVDANRHAWWRQFEHAVPVMLLLSSEELGRGVEICRKLGVDAYLTKPLRESALFESLCYLVAGSTIIDEPAKVPSTPAISHGPYVVLLVEDNPVNQLFAATVIKNLGHKVVLARRADEALQAIEREPFDICLMDIEMPDMDGFAATRAIRKWGEANNAYLPIVALTAHALKGFRERCLEAGMDDYLSKPVRSADLQAMIELHAPAARKGPRQ